MNPPRFSGRTRTSLVLIHLVAGIASIGSQAHAQSWLPDRVYTEGPGIRAGDLEVHPGVAIRGGYDSNVFRADGDIARSADGAALTQKERASGILAVTPHIHLSTLSAQRIAQGETHEGEQRSLPAVAFRGGASATYFHYFIEDGPKNLEVDSDLVLSIMPQRPVNVDLQMIYERHVRPFTQFAFQKNAYDFHVIQPRVRLNMGSRSQVLTTYVGYTPRAVLYESRVFDYLDSLTHGIEAGAGWKFLPNTALIFDGLLDLQNYGEENARATSSPVVFSNNKRFRTRLGLNGALTRKLSLRVLAGYAAMVFDDENDGQRLDDHEDVIGEAILSVHFGPALTSRFEVGYQRDLMSSALGGWTRFDRGFLRLGSLLGRVFLLTLEGAASYVGYGSLVGYDRSSGLATLVPLGAGGKTDRNDVRLEGAIRGEYRATNWLSLMADVSVQNVITDFDYALYFGGSPVPDPADYFTLMAFGGVRVHY